MTDETEAPAFETEAPSFNLLFVFDQSSVAGSAPDGVAVRRVPTTETEIAAEVEAAASLESSGCKVVVARCGLSDYPDADTVISWDEDRREFTVDFVAKGHAQEPKNLVDYLTLHVARESRCSCGSVLKLESHVIRRVNNDLEFSGTYKCPDCSVQQSSGMTGLIGVLKRLWNSTTKVQIGPSGITYERDL